MPRYDFLCRCGHRFETVAKVGTEIVPCDRCHSGARRQFSVATPDQIRLWPERWAVTRSQVGERYVRSQWTGSRLQAPRSKPDPEPGAWSVEPGAGAERP